MRAARFHGREDVRVEEIDAPPVPENDQLLVAVEWCGICGSDLHEFRVGPLQTAHVPHPLTGAVIPQILGHEFAGEVIEAGPLAQVAVGTRVAAMPLVTCGACPSCKKGLNQLCHKRAAIGMNHRWGGFAALALVEAGNVVALHDKLSFEQGALLEPAAVSLTAVKRGKVQPGSSVLIAGAGPIGSLVGLAAVAAGASTIVMSEPSTPRRERVGGLLSGVQVVDPTHEPVHEAVRRLAGGEGVDVAFECVGNQAALEACIQSVRPNGNVVLCGLHPEPPRVDLTLCVEKQLSLLASYCYDTKDWSDVVEVVATGALPVEKIVTRKITLDHIVDEGFGALMDPSSDDIKVLVRTAQHA